MKLEDVKALFETLGGLGAAVNGGLVALAAWLLPTITPSPTFQGYIRFFAVILGVLGVLFSLTWGAGRGREACLQQRRRYSLFALFYLFVFILIVSLTEGVLAEYHPVLSAIREFLIDNNLIANFTVGMSAGSAVYCVLGAVVLSFPSVWDAKLTT